MDFAAVEILKAASSCTLQDERCSLSIHHTIVATREHVICAISDGFTITSLKTFEKAINSTVNLKQSIGSIDTSDSSMEYVCVPDLKSIILSPCESYLLVTTTLFIFLFEIETIQEKVSRKAIKQKEKKLN